MNKDAIKAPFPWFGGKSRAAELIWSRFGDVDNYVEPFAGSLAVLLLRPHWPFPSDRARVETVNDNDAYVANFWRAIAADPDAVAEAADWPVNEVDLHARHQWLHGQAERIERLKCEPDFYDARIAGFWSWGLSSWIGDNFCRPNRQNALPHLGAGQGVNRKLPHLGAGQGVNRQLPHLGDPGKGGCADRRERLVSYFQTIADRLRGVRVCCGDWKRVLTPSVTFRHGPTAILLDPPYDVDGVGYGEDHSGLSSEVRSWAIANACNDMKIALCGYADEGHADELAAAGWSCEAWKAGGGYNNLGDKKNSLRERIWFSPACETTSLNLFS